VTAVPGPVYIAFEGPEGCGKSTQARRLADSLGALLTRETGGTPIGERLRAILHDVTVTDLDERAETLIVAADRAQHLAQVVRPALTAGRDVVTDRSVYSSLAYQGWGRGLPVDEVRRVNEWAVGETWPHLVVLLDADDAVLESRMSGRELDRFEQAGAAFHDRVRAGFRTMADADPEHWVSIDAAGDVDTIETEVRAAVRERLGR
jgi:dTMP kinase